MWGREEGASYLSWCSGEPRLVCSVPCLRVMGNELISNHMKKKTGFLVISPFFMSVCVLLYGHIKKPILGE